MLLPTAWWCLQPLNQSLHRFATGKTKRDFLFGVGLVLLDLRIIFCYFIGTNGRRERAESVTKVLRGLNIEIAHKPTRSISSILKKPEDKIGKGASKGVVHQIKYKGCNFVYVGQTSRSRKTRVKNK